MLRLDREGFAVSTGSACHAGRPQPSPVLLAMGVAEAESLATIRVSFGITNREQELRRFLGVLEGMVAELRR